MASVHSNCFEVLDPCRCTCRIPPPWDQHRPALHQLETHFITIWPYFWLWPWMLRPWPWLKWGFKRTKYKCDDKTHFDLDVTYNPSLAKVMVNPPAKNPGHTSKLSTMRAFSDERTDGTNCITRVLMHFKHFGLIKVNQSWSKLIEGGLILIRHWRCWSMLFNLDWCCSIKIERCIWRACNKRMLIDRCTSITPGGSTDADWGSSMDQGKLINLKINYNLGRWINNTCCSAE